MPGVVFDRAAAYYDATRGYPPGVDEQLRDAIVARLGLAAQARIAEPAVGTGRIALPFLRAGYRYVGVDLARPMMLELRRKLGRQPERALLAEGDVMRLPLAGGAFDVAILVHILHLVDDWAAALDEALRVVRPGGAVVLANDQQEHQELPPPPEQVWPMWATIMEELAVPPEQRRAGAVRGLDERFAERLRAGGASVERVRLISYQRAPISARETVARYTGRVFSSCWAMPDDLHAEASRRLERWLAERCDDPDTPYALPAHVDAIIATRPATRSPVA